VYCEALKYCLGLSEQKAWNADIRCSAPHTAARTRVLLEHFNWELLDHTPYSSDVTPSDYHRFTYLKNWLESQRFNNNAKLMECVKMWPSSGRQISLTQAHKKLLPRCLHLQVVKLCTYFLYTIKFLFLIACFVNSSVEATFPTALVYNNIYMD
jgi:hypothetical protein